MIEIYTDGSCYPNDGTGDGTCGFVVVKNEMIIHTHVDGRTPTTNNRMELLGIIKAFIYAKTNHYYDDVTIYSDSQYCVKGFNEWYFGWLKNPNKLAKAKNLDMWNYLHNLRSENIELVWVKGHSINEYNNAIDEICNREFKRRYGKQFHVFLV
jgi:ribonuclease HI